jgi:hypothetical protein
MSTSLVNPSVSSINLANVPPFFNRLPNWGLKFRAGRAAARAGLSQQYTTCTGDSQTAGTGANGVTAYPRHLAYQLNAAGLPSGQNAAFAYIFNDTRVVMTGGFSTGNNMFGASAAGKLTFTPVDNVDTFDVYYLGWTNSSPCFTIDVDGGTATSVNTTSNSTFSKVAIAAGSIGKHSLNVNWVSGQVFIGLVVGYNSAQARMNIINTGCPGATAANLINNGSFSVQNIGKLVSPCLTIIKLWTNEASQNTPIATFTTNIQTLITTGLTTVMFYL